MSSVDVVWSSVITGVRSAMVCVVGHQDTAVSLKHQSGSRARARGTAMAEAHHEGLHRKPQLCLHHQQIWLKRYQVNFETCHQVPFESFKWDLSLLSRF